MVKENNRKKEKALKVGPVRTLLQELLREKTKTRKSKEELARYLELSISAVEAMIYQGQGGLDAWVNALLYCYDIKKEALPFLLSHLTAAIGQSLRQDFKQNLNQDDIDQSWILLKKELSRDEKYFWLQVIRSVQEKKIKIRIDPNNAD